MKVSIIQSLKAISSKIARIQLSLSQLELL